MDAYQRPDPIVVEQRPDTTDTPPERGCYPPPPRPTPPHDALLVPAVWDLITPHVQRAQAGWVGPLPGLRSDEFLDAPEHVQVAVLLLIGSHRIFADPHQTVRALLRQVGHDIHGGDRDRWRRLGFNHARNAALVAERKAERAAADERHAERAAAAGHPRPHDFVRPTAQPQQQDPAA